MVGTWKPLCISLLSNQIDLPSRNQEDIIVLCAKMATCSYRIFNCHTQSHNNVKPSIPHEFAHFRASYSSLIKVLPLFPLPTSKQELPAIYIFILVFSLG